MGESPESLANVRYALVQSARDARRSGYTRQVWTSSPGVREFVEAVGLDLDLLEHIASWVWDPIRRGPGE